MSTHDKLARLIHSVETKIDKLRYAAKDKLGISRPVKIQPYIGFGTSEKLFIRGRVLQDRGTLELNKDTSRWRNLRAAIRALNSNEVPHAKVYLPDFDKTVEANDEGFIEEWLELSEKVQEIVMNNGYYYINASIENNHAEGIFETTLPVAIPSEQAAFGVISDIDDTVLQSDATRTLSMISKVLFENAQTRQPFEGVSELYQALTAKDNPIFYVSSSPWNLYEMLLAFINLNNIPQGPLMLRDWGISAQEFLPSSHENYKLNALKMIFDSYPDLSFMLIGDSGQEDPEIYHSLLDLYGDRILAIYIRDVSDEARDSTIEKLQASSEAKGITFMLSKDSESVAIDALKKGWINQTDLANVQSAVSSV